MKPRVWHTISEELKKEHLRKFREYSPTLSIFYALPANVGKKPGSKIRKRKLNAPTFIDERIETEKQPAKIRIRRDETGNYYSVDHTGFDISKLDPRRKQLKELTLRRKSSHKMVTK